MGSREDTPPSVKLAMGRSRGRQGNIHTPHNEQELGLDRTLFSVYMG